MFLSLTCLAEGKLSRGLQLYHLLCSPSEQLLASSFKYLGACNVSPRQINLIRRRKGIVEIGEMDTSIQSRASEEKASLRKADGVDGRDSA